MVERYMYWNNRGAGTDTIGGFLDSDQLHRFELCALVTAYQTMRNMQRVALWRSCGQKYVPYLYFENNVNSKRPRTGIFRWMRRRVFLSLRRSTANP